MFLKFLFIYFMYMSTHMYMWLLGIEFRTKTCSGQPHLLWLVLWLSPSLLQPKDLLIIINMYTVAVFRLRVVVSHHVVAGI